MLPSPYGSFQNNFNPFQSNANPGTTGFIYQSLLYFNTVGSEQYPQLATDYSWSADNKTMTVNLQPNAKWTDGQPFTSKDVVFTFNELKQYPAADTNGVWQELTDVKANGDNQVVFTFKQVDVPFAVYVLGTYIVPEHIWSSLGDPTKASTTQPVGTGPFTLDTFTSQGYKLKANPDYYLGQVPVSEISIPAYSSNDSADLALAQGQVDWGGLFIPNIDKVYTSKSDNNKYWFPPSNVVMLYTNLKDPTLSSLPVRQAISAAIDRNEIVQKAEDGYAKPASPTGLVLPTYQDWVDPSLNNPTFTTDAAQAQKYLTDAGYKKGSDGIYAKNGKKLSLTLQVVSGWSDWDTTASLIAQQLKKVGIDVKVQQEQYGAYFSNMTAHKFQLAISWTNVGPSPYYLYSNMLRTGVQWNLEQWSNPATDKALADFSGTTDKTAQQQAIYKLENTMAKQLPSIPLFYGPYWYEYNTSRYTGWPTASDPYVTPPPFSWPAPAIVVMHLKPVQ